MKTAASKSVVHGASLLNRKSLQLCKYAVHDDGASENWDDSYDKLHLFYLCHCAQLPGASIFILINNGSFVQEPIVSKTYIYIMCAMKLVSYFVTEWKSNVL